VLADKGTEPEEAGTVTDSDTGKGYVATVTETSSDFETGNAVGKSTYNAISRILNVEASGIVTCSGLDLPKTESDAELEIEHAGTEAETEPVATTESADNTDSGKTDGKAAGKCTISELTAEGTLKAHIEAATDVTHEELAISEHTTALGNEETKEGEIETGNETVPELEETEKDTTLSAFFEASNAA